MSTRRTKSRQGPVDVPPPLEPLERRLMLSDVGALATDDGLAPSFPAGPAADANPGPGVPSKPPPEWTTGLKRVLYLRVTFADKPTRRPQTISSARRSMAFADAFVRANSYGATSFRTTFTDVIVLPKPESGYGSAKWLELRADALDAAKALRPSWDAERYDFDVIRYDGGPSPQNGRSSGFANTGARGCWLRDSTPEVATHELGHNLGLSHANLWEPADPDAPAGPGRNVEYGNTFDVMGGGADAGLGGHFNAYEKNFLGWLPDANVQVVDHSGTYRVYPADSTSAPAEGQDYALKVRKDDLRDYWLSSRGDSFWSNNASLGGLEVDWGAWSKDEVDNSNLGSQLLDMTPGTAAGRFDFGLPLGRTFTDEAAGVHVTPLRRDPSGAVNVDIVFDADEAPDLNAPEPPTISLDGAAPSADGADAAFPLRVYTAAAGQTFSLTATSRDADGDDLAYAWDFGSGAAGGATGPGGAFADVTPAAAARYEAPGLYRAQVTVSDRRGLTASASVLLRIVAAGVSSPSNAVTGQVMDAIGRPMEHVRVTSATSSTYTDHDGTYALVNLPAAPDSIAASTPGGWTFAPLDFANPVQPGPVTRGVDFRGTPVGYHVSGTVTMTSGAPVAGVLVSDGDDSALTDAFGHYTLPAANGPHTLTFDKLGYRIPDFAVQVDNADATADRVVELPFIAGTVFDLPADVRSVTVTNGQQTTTAEVSTLNGRRQAFYTLRDVPETVSTFGVTALGAGGAILTYAFAPDSWTNPLPVQDVKGFVNFTYQPQKFVARGRITEGGGPVFGAMVTAIRASTREPVASGLTDIAGRYELPPLPPGEYVLAARRARFVFMPLKLPVTLKGNVSSLDFRARAASDPPPTFVHSPTADPALVTGVSTVLTSSATDESDDPRRLVYSWRLLSGPSGATVSFSRNASNAARQTLATFDRPGAYTIESSVQDPHGGRATNSVSVNVVSVPTGLRLDTPYQVLPAGGTHQFSAVTVDQFGLPVAQPLPVTWTLVGDVGTLGANGSFVAGGGPISSPVRGAVIARVGLRSGREITGSSTIDLRPPATVVARQLFYNDSAYDAHSPGAHPGDDRAIAPDKRPLLPGDGRATAANYTGYDKGINGVMVDLDGAWATSFSASDFDFAVGFGAEDSRWTAAPPPREIATRTVLRDGRPVQRITLVWDNDGIRNQWLRVTVLATDRTGLSSPDVFYFGNLAGDTADAAGGATTARVTAADVEQTLRRSVSIGDLASVFDHDRDGAITVADALVARRNQSSWIELITG